MSHIQLITTIIAVIFLSACNQRESILKEHQFPTPPIAEVIPSTFSEFGKSRTDNYYWLKDKDNPKVIEYLKAENSYTESVMSSTKALQKTLFNEIKGRIKEVDGSYPLYVNGYYYYSRTEEGRQYRIYCRKKGFMDAPEEVMFNVNEMADGKSAMIFASTAISKDNRYAAYLYNETGSYAEFTLKIRDLYSSKDFDETIEGVSSITWSNDSRTLYYSKIDRTLRPNRIYSHTLGSKGQDKLIYEESDQKFSVDVSKSKTYQYIVIQSSSATTSETLLIPADKPDGKPEVFLSREKDVEYNVAFHLECFYVKMKDKNNLNGMIYKVPLKSPGERSTWKTFIPHQPNAKIESFSVLKDYIAVDYRINGLNEVKITSLKDGSIKNITFPEPVYSAYFSGNPEYNATTVRYTYTSLNRPSTIFDYDIITGESIKLKEQEIPSGFNPDDYVVERLWAKGNDQSEVPMAIVYKKGLRKNKKNPVYLYAYGSYGSSTDADFSAPSYSLIDRGFVYAIAQVRGGSEMGEQWYHDGKLMHKMNSFTDFIACAEKLIADGYTDKDLITASGGSAGGLLMGAVANMRPDLFRTIVAEVPFVDVVTTMLDSTLPLTTQEYEEWGDPNTEDAYKYMLSYSPYDNVKKGNYPNILATGGINDSQVLFHEPAKWVARLRANKTNDNLVLLYMNMESGHGGATGRYDSIKETAFQWAFILNMVGINK